MGDSIKAIINSGNTTKTIIYLNMLMLSECSLAFHEGHNILDTHLTNQNITWGCITIKSCAIEKYIT